MSQQLVVRYLSSDQDANPGRSYSESAPVLTQSWSLKHPTGPGQVGQARRLSADGTTLEWFTPAVDVTSTAVGAYLVYAGPDTPGYPENPTFRALTLDYLPDIPPSKIDGIIPVEGLPIGIDGNSIPLGNDPRFHTQNTDLGTTSDTFRIGTGLASTEVILKAVAGKLELRNAADTDFADFRVGNLITGNEVNIGDNVIFLNSDAPGGSAPTEDGGIWLNRGPESTARMEWNEAGDEWQAGLAGAMAAISRRKIFSVTQAEANTVGGFPIVHNLGTWVGVTCWLNNERFFPVNETVSDGTVIIDFGGIQFTGFITVRIDA